VTTVAGVDGGGGIYCEGGSATIRYNTITDNTTAYWGGAS